jgi:acyl carrier protein
MTRQEVLDLMCEAARLPSGSIHGHEMLDAVPGWDSLAGVDFEMVLLDRWDVELDPMKVTEAETVGDILALLRHRIEG